MGGGELTNTNTVESEIVASQLQMRVAQGKDTLKSLDPTLESVFPPKTALIGHFFQILFQQGIFQNVQR